VDVKDVERKVKLITFKPEAHKEKIPTDNFWLDLVEITGLERII